jgi:hypothetical protein
MCNTHVVKPNGPRAQKAWVSWMFWSASDDIIWDDSDGSGISDVNCDFTLDHVGSWGSGLFVISGPFSDGNITSSSEFDWVSSASTYVKVVPTITWCGAFIPGIAGCACIGCKNSMMVADWAIQGSIAAVVLAHEYGHSTGLNDRTQVLNFMNGSAASGNVRVTDTQCPKLRDDHVDSDGPGGNPAPLLATQGAPDPSSESSDFSMTPIEALARSVFVNRLPFEAEDFYGPEDVATLRGMLADPQNAEFGHTIVALIALLSDGVDEDAALLVSLVESDRGAPLAITAATGLGYMAEYGSKRALQFLLQEAQGRSTATRDAAIAGLALSGKPEANALLKALRTRAKPRSDINAPPTVTSDGDARPSVSPRQAELDLALLDESIATNETIAANGRRAFFGR